jgi:hypothetical protein
LAVLSTVDMDKPTFQKCIESKQFPDNGHIILKALYFDALGDWEAAHDIAQSKEGTLIYDHLHAYLHRKEGDDWNAQYWYRRVATTMPKKSLKEEWADLVDLFVNM